MSEKKLKSETNLEQDLTKNALLYSTTFMFFGLITVFGIGYPIMEVAKENQRRKDELKTQITNIIDLNKDGISSQEAYQMLLEMGYIGVLNPDGVCDIEITENSNPITITPERNRDGLTGRMNVNVPFSKAYKFIEKHKPYIPRSNLRH